MSPKPRFRFVNVVWGNAYTDMLLELSLPSQLWPNNLVYFAQNSDSIYRIYTTIADSEKIQGSKAYARLSNLMPVEVILIGKDIKPDRINDSKYQLMNEMHRDFVKTSQQENCALFFLQPDVIVADGSFRNLLNIMASGKRAIMVSGPRLTKETMMPEVMQKYTKDGILQPIGSRELVKLAMNHLHPDTQSLLWNTAKSTIEPYYLIWKVGDQGMLLRAFHLHPIIIDPVNRDTVPEVTLDVDYVQKACPNFEDIYVVQDSDEFVFFSLTEEHERWEFFKQGPTNIYDVVQYAKKQTNSFHQEHLNYNIRYHSADLSNEWEEAEKESESVVESVLSIVHGRTSRSHQPSLSIIMTCHNQGCCIIESLASALAQSYRPTEIFVIDDCSTDNSTKLIEDFARKEPLVKLIRCEQNEEQSLNLNKLLKLSTGDYIYKMSAGDKVQPGFFEKSMASVATYSAVGLCCSDIKIHDSRTGDVWENRYNWSNTASYFFPTDLAEIIQGGYLPGSAAIMKRSVLIEAGGFLPELKWYSDWFAFLVVAFRHGITFIPEPLVLTLVSPNSYLEAGKRNWRQQSAVLSQLLKTAKSSAYRDILPYFIRASVFSYFGEDVVKAVMSNPENWDTETIMLLQEPLWQRNLLVQNSIAQRNKIYQEAKAQGRVQTYFTRANTFIKEGRLNEALTIFDNLIQEMPNVPNVYAAKASLALKMRKFELARHALLTALELAPNDPKLLFQLGTVISRCGDKQAAEQIYRQVLELEPDNLAARKNLTRLT